MDDPLIGAVLFRFNLKAQNVQCRACVELRIVLHVGLIEEELRSELGKEMKQNQTLLTRRSKGNDGPGAGEERQRIGSFDREGGSTGMQLIGAHVCPYASRQI